MGGSVSVAAQLRRDGFCDGRKDYGDIVWVAQIQCVEERAAFQLLVALV